MRGVCSSCRLPLGFRGSSTGGDLHLCAILSSLATSLGWITLFEVSGAALPLEMVQQFWHALYYLNLNLSLFKSWSLSLQGNFQHVPHKGSK